MPGDRGPASAPPGEVLGARQPLVQQAAARGGDLTRDRTCEAVSLKAVSLISPGGGIAQGEEVLMGRIIACAHRHGGVGTPHAGRDGGVTETHTRFRKERVGARHEEQATSAAALTPERTAQAARALREAETRRADRAVTSVSARSSTTQSGARSSTPSGRSVRPATKPARTMTSVPLLNAVGAAPVPCEDVQALDDAFFTSHGRRRGGRRSLTPRPGGPRPPHARGHGRRASAGASRGEAE